MPPGDQQRRILLMSRFCAIYVCHRIRFRIAFPEEVSFVGGVGRRKVMSQGGEDFVATM